MNDNSFEGWINQIANNNGSFEMVEFEDVCYELGYPIELQYPDRSVQEFVFYHEIQN